MKYTSDNATENSISYLVLMWSRNPLFDAPDGLPQRLFEAVKYLATPGEMVSMVFVACLPRKTEATIFISV